MARKLISKLLLSSKVFNFLLFLPFLMLASVFFIGILKDDPVGYFAFGLILATIFCDLLVIFGIFSTHKFLKYSCFTWVLFCLICLIYPVLFRLDLSNPHSAIASEYSMLILSFPSGIVSSVVHYQLGGKLEGVMSMVLSWGLFAIAGFLQWFVLMPKIIMFIKNKFGKNNAVRRTP